MDVRKPSRGSRAIGTLRAFVDGFGKEELSKLRPNDCAQAEAVFRDFVDKGAEVLCAAGAVDATATVSEAVHR